MKKLQTSRVKKLLTNRMKKLQTNRVTNYRPIDEEVTDQSNKGVRLIE